MDTTKQLDIANEPKQFCENITVGFSNDSFALVVHTGNQHATYALTPQHTKRLAQYLNYQVGEFEKVFGSIKADWTPNMPSPIQVVPKKK